MKKACKDCPFRKDAPKGWLGKERTTELANEVILGDSSFHCHKSLTSTGKVGKKSILCAGSIILATKEGRGNRLYRMLDHQYDCKSSEIVDSAQEFISLHTI